MREVLRLNMRRRIFELELRRGFLFLHAALMLSLVNDDDLINKFDEGLFLVNSDQSILDDVLETEVKQNALGAVVEVQKSDDLLKINCV